MFAEHVPQNRPSAPLAKAPTRKGSALGNLVLLVLLLGFLFGSHALVALAWQAVASWLPR